MNLRPSHRACWPGLATALAFALLALALRSWGSYPICHNDEVNWIGIARQLDQGQPWPVSGPAFIQAVRELAWQLQTSHAQAISLIGIGGVFVAVLLLLWGYRRLALAGTAATLAMLALSSYFWAPLLEARPQQWGQILVFCGTICCWLWLHRRGGTAFFLVLPLIAFTHILSHAILLWLCSVLVLADYAENRPLTRRHLAVLLALLFSLLTYLWPGGPYAVMLQDVEQNHLHRLLVWAPQIGGALLLAGLIAIGVQRQWHWRPAWSQALARTMLQRKTAARLSALAIILTALALQAILLPTAAWRPYGGSVWLFIWCQTGNVLFAAFFVLGLHHFIQGLLAQELDPLMGRLLVWVLVALGALSLVAVVASWWLLDTNWFLRVLNYGLLFAAIVAALGLQRLRITRAAPLAYALLPLGCLASLVFVLRPPWLLGC
ncbi:hypothetical protein GCM10027082_33150 [Comamonas humi]